MLASGVTVEPGVPLVVVLRNEWLSAVATVLKTQISLTFNFFVADAFQRQAAT